METDDTLRILVVDDDEDDFMIAQELLEEIPGVDLSIEWANSFDAAVERIKRKDHHVYFFDFHLGAHTGLDLLHAASAHGVEAPIFLLTGERDRDVDMAVMDAGATAYLIKDQIDTSQLDRAIRYALRQKEAVGEIRHQAQHDVLTGLPNRLLFHHTFERALAHASRFSQRLAVLFVDLDSFKEVNDTYGHDAGDVVLKAVADRLAHSIRLTDSIARHEAQQISAGRLGGDEFIVLLTNVERTENVALVAERITRTLAKPCAIPNGKEASISASIGIALFPDDGKEAQVLLKKADSAMYRAKARGKNQFFFVDDTSKARRGGRAAQLRSALAEGALELRYRPVMRLEDGALLALEATAHVQSAELAGLDGRELAMVAADAGLSERYDCWLVRESRDQALRWTAASRHQVMTAVRLDRASQVTATLDVISALLHEVKDAQVRVNLLFAGTHMAYSDDQFEVLNKLRVAGCELGIDDAERSPLPIISLVKLPLSTLYIGAQEIAEMDEGPEASRVIQSIVALAKANGWLTVARGVCTEEQCERLRQLGCDATQGPFWGEPLNVESAEQLLERVLKAEAASS